MPPPWVPEVLPSMVQPLTLATHVPCALFAVVPRRNVKPPPWEGVPLPSMVELVIVNDAVAALDGTAGNPVTVSSKTKTPLPKLPEMVLVVTVNEEEPEPSA